MQASLGDLFNNILGLQGLVKRFDEVVRGGAGRGTRARGWAARGPQTLDPCLSRGTSTA